MLKLHLTVTGSVFVLFLVRSLHFVTLSLSVNFSVFGLHFQFLLLSSNTGGISQPEPMHTMPDLSHVHSRNPFYSFLPQTTKTAPTHTYFILDNIKEKAKQTHNPLHQSAVLHMIS